MQSKAVLTLSDVRRSAQAAEADAERISLDAQIEWADAADLLTTARYTLGIHRRQLEHLERVLRGAGVQFEAGRRNVAQLIGLRDSRYNAEQRRAVVAYARRRWPLGAVLAPGSGHRRVQRDPVALAVADERPVALEGRGLLLAHVDLVREVADVGDGGVVGNPVSDAARGELGPEVVIALDHLIGDLGHLVAIDLHDDADRKSVV